ncbi:hypothetical protein [Pontibacter ruber]|nr:hypothetical protein [Pontibacter ruber]
MLVCTPFYAKSQQTGGTEKSWSFLVEPYLMFPSMNGTTGISNLPDVEVDASAKDIFSNLKIGAMLYAEATRYGWTLSSDILYMNLEKDTRTGALIERGELSAKQFGWEVSALRRILPFMDIGIGGRYNNIKAWVDLTLNTRDGPEERSKERAEGWIDPILISRFSASPTDNLLLQLRADIGGFGVGADLAWQAQAYAGYRFSELFHMSLGYRIISIDYEKGSGEDRFLYDVNTTGPVIRLGFNF